MEKKQGIGFFEKYLTIWVALCIIIGIAVGQWLPAIPQTLSKFEYANVSIPVAILIWLMIYPMMLKVDFQSVKNVGKRPKGIMVTCVTNWLIKPFTMFGIAYLFAVCFKIKILKYFKFVWYAFNPHSNPFFLFIYLSANSAQNFNKYRL